MRQRKTKDEFQLWIDYGYGLEEVCAEETLKEIKTRAKEYYDNQFPSIRKMQIKKKRIRLEEKRS